MRTSIALALGLLLAACGGSDKPDTTTTPEPVEQTDPTEPTDVTEPGAMTAAECESAGNQVAWDIGDGSVACPAGTTEVGKVSGGVEAALCCQPAPDDAE